MNQKVNVVLVTGLSGAGSTSVTHILETMGYYCIDKIPTALLKQFGELMKDNPLYKKVAITIPLQEDADEIVNIFNDMDWIDFKLAYLVCSEEVLFNRYRLTRRTHPLILSGVAASLEEAILKEKELGQEIKKHADCVIDTTKYQQATLRKIVTEYFQEDNDSLMSVSFLSFGYKLGVPKDADLVFDVRHLPNPYYDESLRHMTGNDKPVYDFVMEAPETKKYVEKVITFLEFQLSEYNKSGRSFVMVAIGCTGGWHRSVSLINYLNEYFKGKYQVFKIHREQEVD